MRYRNALLHAAAQFVRVAREVGLHVGKLHVAQRLNRTLTEHLAGANALVVAHDLRDLLEHRRHGVHRRERVLHDERDLAPANRAHLRLAECQQIATVELEAVGTHTAGRRHHAQERETQCALARCGLADEPNDLTAPHVERHGVDSAHNAAANRELDGEPLNPDERL